MDQLLLVFNIQNDFNKSWCISSLGMFSFLELNLQRLCLLTLSRFLLHFHSLERKNAFAKIDPILKYEVLRHNDLNTDVHIPKLHICLFSPFKTIVGIYEVKNTRTTTLLTERKRIHQKYVGAPENMTPGHPAILCEKDVNKYCSRIRKKVY